MTSRIDSPDTLADLELRALLDREDMSGFVMVAGAGSGKTTSLVKALAHVTHTRGPALRAKNQRVACITYTEVAAREIHHEIGNDPLASVSTIHSFLWSIAKPFQRNIKEWILAHINGKIEALQEKRLNYGARTRQSTKDKDAVTLNKLESQQDEVAAVAHWKYGLGSDYSRGILGHSDVLKMVPSMIIQHTLLAKLVAYQFPVVFVDESQDTFPEVVECLKHASSLANGNMCLGFFGDPMQQIYQQGAKEIGLEPGWSKIDKPENFRSSRRVLACVNAVRSEGDALQQVSGLGESQPEGEAFCFVLPADDQRSEHLRTVTEWLNEKSAPGRWIANESHSGAKVLMIAHRMAARRLGFAALHAAFNDNQSSGLKDAFNEGRAWPLAPFNDVLLPLCASGSNSAAVIPILRNHSPLLAAGNPPHQFKEALRSSQRAVKELKDFVEITPTATLRQVLELAASRRLIEVDPRLAAYLGGDPTLQSALMDDGTIRVLDAMAQCLFSELKGYYKYINNESPYSTQHGTKGSEFDHVLVVLDDHEGNYSLYSYDKLFGLRDSSATDIERQAQGQDSAIERTRRLFYVCISRARHSLAIALFTENVPLAVEAIQKSSIGEHVQILTVSSLD